MTIGAWVALLLLVVSIAIAQWRLLDKRHGAAASGDWATFDKKRLLVTRVADGDTIIVRSTAGETRVRLLGVDAPELRRENGSHPDHWADRAAAYTRGRAEGKFVTLQLDPPQTRDTYDRLLAYVYLSDTDCLNMDLVRDGQAYADRRFKHSFRPQYEMAENEARKKQRGLWRDVTVEQMPAWRREWLRELESRR
jgi:endonuclease YncB( thermonuclease family)